MLNYDELINAAPDRGADTESLALSAKWVERAQRCLDHGELRGGQRAAIRRAIRLRARDRDALVVACERLIYSIVGEHVRGGAGHVDTADVEGDAWAEYCEAFNTWDPERGVPFAKYLALCVRRRVPRSVASSRVGENTLPRSWAVVAKHAKRARRTLESELGRSATRDEVYTETERRCLTAAGSAEVLRRSGVEAALRDFDSVVLAAAGTTSLDRRVGEDSDTCVGDLITGDVGADTASLSDEVSRRLFAVRDLAVTGDPGLRAEVFAALDGDQVDGRSAAARAARDTDNLAARFGAAHVQYVALCATVERVADVADVPVAVEGTRLDAVLCGL